MIRFVVGVGLALAALLGAFWLEGGSFAALLGFTAFLITFFVPLFGVLAVWSFETWVLAWKHAFTPAPAAEAGVSIEIWKFSEFACYLAGLLGSLVGAILILGSFENPAVPWFHSLAALLVGPLYGLIFGFVARILRARVEMLKAQ